MPGPYLLCPGDPEPAKPWEPSIVNSDWRPSVARYPHTGELKAGDIVLFMPVQANSLERTLQRFQRCAPFTHAAIYMGDDQTLCEALPLKGVVDDSKLVDKLAGRCIAVRRVPNVDDQTRQEIVTKARAFVGGKYSWPQIWQIATQRLRNCDSSLNERITEGFICSTFCERAIFEATNAQVKIRFFNDIVTPSDILVAPSLVDVPLEWRKVVPK